MGFGSDAEHSHVGEVLYQLVFTECLVNTLDAKSILDERGFGGFVDAFQQQDVVGSHGAVLNGARGRTMWKVLLPHP